VTQGENQRAAELLGAEAQLREYRGIEIDALEQQVLERAVAHARTELGDERFAAASRRGGALKLDEIVELCVS
jgi:hypothetical protein